MIRAHVLTYYIILHSVFNLSAASHAYRARHDRFSGAQSKYFKGIPLAYCFYCGSQLQHSLTLRTFLYLVILKKFQFSLFYPVLIWILETGRSWRTRWRIATAAHNMRVLIGQITCQSLRTVNCEI